VNDLDSSPQTVGGAALVAHLSCDFMLPGQFPQHTRFVDIVRQRLLAVNMFTHSDSGGGNGRVHVVGSSDVHGIERFLLIEHLAEIFIYFGVGIFLLLLLSLALVDIA
jgi:hypothetical protein